MGLTDVAMVTDVTARVTEGAAAAVVAEVIDVVGIDTEVVDTVEVTAVLTSAEVKSCTGIGDDRDGDSGSVERRSESCVSS